MDDDDLLLRLLFSIRKYSHLERIANHLHGDSAASQPLVDIAELDSYITYLCQGVLFDATGAPGRRAAELCTRMEKVYEKTRAAYKAALELSRGETLKTKVRYGSIVLANRAIITEAADHMSLKDIDDVILRARNAVNQAPNPEVFDAAFIEADWTPNFEPHEEALTELREVREKMNVQIAAVEKVLRDNERMKTARQAKIIGAAGAIIALFGILVAILVNFDF